MKTKNPTPEAESGTVDLSTPVLSGLAFVEARYAEAERHPEGSQERVIARCLGEGAHAMLILFAKHLGLSITDGNPEVLQ